MITLVPSLLCLIESDEIMLHSVRQYRAGLSPPIALKKHLHLNWDVDRGETYFILFSFILKVVYMASKSFSCQSKAYKRKCM